jgi:hypothetical protein
MAYPDYEQALQNIWGWSDETVGMLPVLALASNILVGTNPPYSASDFYQWFSSFGGTPEMPLGTLDGTTGTVTAVSDFTNLAKGQAVAGMGIPSGTLITALDSTAGTIQLSNPTTYAGIVTLTVYVAPLVPLAVLNSFIYLATSSILQVRYCEMWPFAMALYIAHYLTLWLNSQGTGTASTPGQLASQGLAMGIAISKHVGDVSLASQPLRMPEEFGAWQLTSYGQQLATIGMAVGSGAVWLW